MDDEFSALEYLSAIAFGALVVLTAIKVVFGDRLRRLWWSNT